jgi:hypothetical protein
MKYFDKSLLDNRPIERIEEQLEAYQTIIWDYSVLAKYREYYSEIMEELLDYYNNRIEKEISMPKPVPDDLPF